jgi:WD40 repeat protein/serine/threonine protein kinase
VSKIQRSRDMNAERAKQAHAIFTQALDLPRERRDEFVRGQVGEDERLAGAVHRLLRAAEHTTDFLETPALSKLRPAPVIPDAVGNYLVVGVLGSGGMATVYEAVQENPNRRVALKVMHPASAWSTGTQHDAEAALRFRLESQALARLRHPAIAQIYEAGTAHLSGTIAPFFAMELVPDALPITEFATSNALPLRKRLELFIQVCDAVLHGHQQGVIHRDIKPDNVLVGPDGAPKVIDFGIARTLDAPSSPTRDTDTKRLLGTLSCMSPEQCNAPETVDARSDVYSLGVLLYELVTDQRPYDLRDVSIPQAVHRIVHEPPREPAFPKGHPYRDLRAIIFKSLEKQPIRRYASVAGLAGDVRRLLDFKAIEARPPSLSHQVRLFAKRHRTFVAAGLALSVGIVILAAVSTGFAVRLMREVRERKSAERLVINERDVARWQAYVAQMSGALSALKADEFQQLRTRLAAVAYQPRGWEWGFLSRLADRSARTLDAHEGMIMELAANRDQTRFVTAADRGSVRLWDATFQRSLASFESESGARMLTAAFTSDGGSVVCGDTEGVVRLLDGEGLQERAVLTRTAGAVRTVVGLPGRRVGIADATGTCSILDLDSGQFASLPEEQPGGVQGLTVSPDEQLLAAFNDQGVLTLRDTATGTTLRTLRFAGRINMVRFSNDSRLVAATGEGGRVLVWEAATGALVREIQATQGINTVGSLAFSYDGTMLALGLVHRDIIVYSLLDGSIIGKLGGHTDAVSGLIFRLGDTELTSTSWDRTIRQWRTEEIASPTGVTTLKGHRDHVRAVAVSPDGLTVVSASEDGDLRFWSPDLGRALARISVGHGSSNGELIAVACGDGAVQLRESCSGTVVREWTDPTRRVTALAFDPTGQKLVIGTEAGAISVWEVQGGDELHVMLGHSARVNSVSISPDALVIASASRDGDVRLWSLSTGLELHRLSGHTSDVFAAIFSPDGRQVYSGSRDQTVLVWDVASGRRVATLTGHGQYVTCLALSPDATRLAAGSWFGEIVLFDVKTFDQVASFRGHDAAIRGIRFSPDGRWLVTGSYDFSVRLFDSATRAEAETAAERAEESFAAGLSVVQSTGNAVPIDLNRLADQVRSRGVDPSRDRWIRAAILATVAPPNDGQ